MPRYDYECDDCGYKFELRRPIHASDEPAPCPNCESTNAKRQISLFVAFSRGAHGSESVGGGCSCGGMCSCGGHDLN